MLTSYTHKYSAKNNFVKYMHGLCSYVPDIIHYIIYFLILRIFYSIIAARISMRRTQPLGMFLSGIPVFYVPNGEDNNRKQRIKHGIANI